MIRDTDYVYVLMVRPDSSLEDFSGRGNSSTTGMAGEVTKLRTGPLECERIRIAG